MYKWLLRWFSPLLDGPSTAEKKAVQKTASTIKSVDNIESPAGQQSPPNVSWMQREAIHADFTDWLFENSDADMFANQTEKNILEAMDKILKSNQSGAKLVRRLPGVIPQLLQSLRTEDYSGAELARKISHDVVLVAAVIRIANSSFFNTSQTVNSIEHAILVLGQEGLRQLITNVAFKPIIDVKSGQFTKLIAPKIWDHSEKCAIACRLLADNAQINPFEPFLAGLVQNVGLIVSLHVMDQMFDGKEPIGSQFFCNSLLVHARNLSCNIAKEWRFPPVVAKAIEEQTRGHKDADMSPIGKILSKGDLLSKLQILIAQDRVSDSNKDFVDTLSEKDKSCINQLNLVPPQE